MAMAEDNNDLMTPRRSLLNLDHLQDEDETEEEEEEFYHQRFGGRWSALSWSSLYERASESSLSWADDELEKDATDKVQSIFNKIDFELYEEEDPTQDGKSPGPHLPHEIKEECSIWRTKFPHLRIIGKSIPAPTYLGDNSCCIDCSVPKKTGTRAKSAAKTKGAKNVRKKSADHKNVSNFSASSVASSISVLTLQEKSFEEDEEEIFASHGVYNANDRNQDIAWIGQGIEVDWVLNEKFESDPKKYLEDKLLEALFKSVWCSISIELQELVDRFSFHIIEQNLDGQQNNFWAFDTMNVPSAGYRMSGMPMHFDSIAEDSVMSGLLGSRQPIHPPRVILSSPISDLNPVSLPNLRPVPSSAPVVRNLGSRLTNHQINLQATQNRWKSTNSFRPISSNVETPRKRSFGTNSQLGGRLNRNSSIEEENVIVSQPFRLRSKSGSPPSRPTTSLKSQPFSLPPIFGTASSSGYSSLTAPSSRLASSTLSTPRSVRLESGKVTPISRPMTSDISISGIRLKKIDVDAKSKGRISSGNAAHWDAKTTLTPSHSRPRFRN